MFFKVIAILLNTTLAVLLTLGPVASVAQAQENGDTERTEAAQYEFLQEFGDESRATGVSYEPTPQELLSVEWAEFSDASRAGRPVADFSDPEFSGDVIGEFGEWGEESAAFGVGAVVDRALSLAVSVPTTREVGTATPGVIEQAAVADDGQRVFLPIVSGPSTGPSLAASDRGSSSTSRDDLSGDVSVAGYDGPYASTNYDLKSDFNGDGFDDLAIGVPGENEGRGAVNVIYGSANGLHLNAQVLNHGLNEASLGIDDPLSAGDNFGAALAEGDFDGDGFDDLAIGVPGEDVGADADIGMVHVVYGSTNGLEYPSFVQSFTKYFPPVTVYEAGDYFGETLAEGDFDGDGFDDLAIGMRFADIGDDPDDAGAVVVLRGTPDGLTNGGPQIWTQGGGIFDGPGEDDWFGYSLAVADFNADGLDDLAVGVPHEDSYGVNSSGKVHIIYGSPSGLSADGDQQFAQSYVNGIVEPAHIEWGDAFGQVLAAGDFNGDGRGDLAVGTPWEDLGPINDAGMVQIFYGASNGLSSVGSQFWHQDSDDMPSIAEQGDHFGETLAAGDFNNDGRDDLAIGAPWENLEPSGEIPSEIPYAGAVTVIYGSPGGLDPLTPYAAKVWYQGSSGIGQWTWDWDYFGNSLTTGDYNGDYRDDLVVGIPYDNVGASIVDAGAIQVIYGSGTQLTIDGSQYWTQDSDGIAGYAEDDDQFGTLR